MTYRPGELDQRVKVLSKQKVSDDMGGNTTSWVETGEYWAHVRPMSGREIQDFDTIQGTALYLFVFRNGLEIKDSDRLDWDGEQFNVRFRKQPKGRAMYIEVNAERGVAQ